MSPLSPLSVSPRLVPAELLDPLFDDGLTPRIALRGGDLFHSHPGLRTRLDVHGDYSCCVVRRRTPRKCTCIPEVIFKQYLL